MKNRNNGKSEIKRELEVTHSPTIEQYLNNPRDRRSAEERLAMAVLLGALKDYLGYRGKKKQFSVAYGNKPSKIYKMAEYYIFSDPEREHLYSFYYICENIVGMPVREARECVKRLRERIINNSGEANFILKGLFDSRILETLSTDAAEASKELSDEVKRPFERMYEQANL